MAISDLNKTEFKSNSNHLNTKEVGTIVDTVQEKHLQSPIHKYRLTNFLYKPPFGLPRNINVPLIRDISRSIYVYSIINRIIDEIVTTKWDIIPKEGVTITPELEKTRREMIEFFKNPNSMNIGFEDFARQILLDTLVLDSGVIVKVFNQFGEMVEMKAVDGGTITKNPDIFNTFNDRSELILDQFNVSFDIPQNRNMTEQEKIKLNGIQTQFKTIYNDTAAYFQYSNFSNASAPIAFGKREIVYLQKNPSPGGVYSYGSPVQASVDTAMSLIFGGKYNLDYFLNGNTPEGIIKVAGADPETLNAVKEKLQNKMQITDNNFGISRRIGHNLPAVSAENVEFIPINFTSKDLEIITQAKWFIRLMWQMFGLSPDEMGECYSEDTRVLTETGLKYHWELSKNDKIATINEEDNSIEYILPVEIKMYLVENRKFHHYKNNCVDVLVSDNHNMYYNTPKVKEFRKSESKDIDINYVNFLQGGLNWKGVNIDKISIPLIEYNNNKDKYREQQIEFSIDDFCEFLGYYLSEGSVLKKMNEKKTYTIKISQTDEENIKIMSPLMDKLGFKREETNWSLSNKSLAIYLSQFGNSNEKFIPLEIKNLPVDKLNILFDALVLGDGHRAEDGTFVRYTTSSRRLADDMLEIFLKIGYKASIRATEFKNENWNTSYNISGNLSQINPRVIINEHRTEEEYTGIMWCPHVNNRPFITERNGKIGIHYNTENSNVATGTTQTRNAMRKGYKPYMNLLEYNFTRNILTEWDNGNLFEFNFDDSDPSSFKERLDIAEQELRMGIKTAEMLAIEFGIDVEILKKSKEEHQEKEKSKMQDEQDVRNPSPEEDNPDTNNKEEVKSVELKSILRSGNKFVVLDKSGKQVIGTYDTLEEAQAQSAGIEINNSEEGHSLDFEKETKSCDKIELKEAIESEEKVDKLSLSQVLKVIKAYVKDDDKEELEELIELKANNLNNIKTPLEKVMKEYISAINVRTKELSKE